ncbi:hypothetical protein GYMLUDRAFT_242774 [Collybiopsis luxurians FD-317 M1]|uniref:Uncharacterized protein n=1 Tax=Collybiopsis luxurians FD-317 M1 TaxID=944289 RepID=A0A0D0D0S5_9AGAR|nr:hypothetical protein GYMLUDRAFT_242774 [Collybiopsis luxurians FD-317 M1]
MSNPTPAYIVPMPITGTKEAPAFDGKDTEDFLDLIQSHACHAGIMDDNKLVNYIVKYSSKSIQRKIKSMKEFKKADLTQTWNTATAKFKDMFSAADEPPNYSLQDLQDFCKVKLSGPSFTKKKEVNNALINFYAISAPLIEIGLLVTDQEPYYFFQSLLKKDQCHIEKKLDPKYKTKKFPLPIKEIL